MPTLKNDQQQIYCLFNANPLTYISGNNWLAQIFTPSVSGNLNKITISVDKIGTPGGDAVVQIRTTSGGTPTGTVLASQAIIQSSVPDRGKLVFTFNSPPALTNGTKYAIVFYNDDGLGGSPSTTNYYRPGWTSSGLDFYGSGTTSYTSTDGGSTWSAYSSQDMAFVTEMDTAPVSPGLDQFSFCKDTGEFVTSNTTYVAQTFTPSVSAKLKQLKLHVQRIDGQTTGNVTVHIQGVDGSNKPNGSDLASQTIPDTSLPSTGNYPYTFTFSSPPTLTLGTMYAIVVKFPNAANPTARYSLNVFPATDADFYATLGREWKSTDSGSTWGNGTYGANSDIGFCTFMEEPVTTTKTINSAATIQITINRLLQSDAFCGQETLKTIDSDGKVIIVSTKTIQSDAFCGQESNQTIQSDVSIGTTETKTIQSDAFCGQETIQTIDADGHIKTTSSKTLSSDASVFITTIQTVNALCHILAYISRNISAASAISLAHEETIDSLAVVIVNEPILKLYVVT